VVATVVAMVPTPVVPMMSPVVATVVGMVTCLPMPAVVGMGARLVVPMVSPVVARVMRMVPGLVVPGLVVPMMSPVVARVMRMMPGLVMPAVSRVVLTMMPLVLDLVRGLCGAVSFVPAGAPLCCGTCQRDVHVVAVP
jgi:hypothetical protein